MEIITEARKALNNSYSPYSNLKVACAILLKNNKIITGTNIENVSYGLSMCAERVALYNLISEGFNKNDILEMAIVSSKNDYITPCGACRQVMIELMNDFTKIYLVNLKNEFKEVTVGELMPYRFVKIE